jgi:hypothetical protein
MGRLGVVGGRRLACGLASRHEDEKVVEMT